MLTLIFAAIVALNLDPTEMQYHLDANALNADGVRGFYRKLSKGGLTHFLVNPNGHNTAYASKVWDPVWCDDPRLKSSAHLKQFENSRILAERGVDWVGIMIEEARKDGIAPFLSMRMNDMHNIGDLYQFSNSRFWLDHPECRRVAGKQPSNNPWDSELAYSYAHPLVREHALALVREMLEKWDVDGFECDWLRFPHHLPPEMELSRSGSPHLTEMMRGVRKIADEIGSRRGRRILVCVRIASRPDAACGLGCDAETWAKEGLVDWVAPCNFFSNEDFQTPWADWKERLRKANPGVKVLGGCDFAGVAREPWHPQGFTECEFAGYLERIAAAGLDGFEAFNRFAYSENPVNRYIQIEGMPDWSAWVMKRGRTYPVSWPDAVPQGYRAKHPAPPCDLSEDRSFTVDIGRVGSAVSCSVILAFEKSVEELRALRGGEPPLGGFRVRLNGVKPMKTAEDGVAAWMPGAKRTKTLFKIDFPLSAAKDGENIVEVGEFPGRPRLMFCALHLAVNDPPSAGVNAAPAR